MCSRCIKYDIECVYDDLPNRRGPDRAPRRRRRSKLQIQAQQQRENGFGSSSASESPVDPSTSFVNSQSFTTVPYVPPGPNGERSSPPTKQQGRHRNGRSVFPALTSSRDSSSSEASDDVDTQRVRQARPVELIAPPITTISIPEVSQATSSASSPSLLNLDIFTNSIGMNPSLQFYRMTWWEMLMSAYSSNTDNA